VKIHALFEKGINNEPLNGQHFLKLKHDDWVLFLRLEAWPVLTPTFENIARQQDKLGKVVGRQDATQTKLVGILQKLQDCTNGMVWFNAFKSVFKRVHKYDAEYPETEAWCLTRGCMPYFCPSGWRRYGFYPDVADTSEMDEIMNHWHVAYHGTSKLNIDSIVENGLVPPGALVNGKPLEVQHGDAGDDGKGTIYLTPSIEYASHWLYATPFIKRDTEGKSTYLYFVLQVRVKPGVFRIQGNTLWEGGWKDTKVPFDLRFGSDELEWLVPRDQAKYIRVTGLMVQKRYVHYEREMTEKFTKHLALSRPQAGPGKWYWNCSGDRTLSEHGPWRPFNDAQSAVIEAAYRQGRSMVYLGDVFSQAPANHTVFDANGKNLYYIDFAIMEQRRADDNSLRRKVARNPPKSEIWVSPDQKQDIAPTPETCLIS